MMSASAEPRGWSAGRWCAAIALVFGIQAALVVLLEDSSMPAPRKPDPAPLFHLSNNRSGEWFALEDPTLFALPRREGFSGEAWLHVVPLAIQADDWSEPAQCLPLPAGELGTLFESFVQTNPSPSFPTIVRLEPTLTVPETFVGPPVATPSRLRIEGDLAKRRLVSPPILASWTNMDLLTNSVLQLLVDARGQTVSAVLLPPGSGLKDADQKALELARSARFVPRTNDPAQIKGASSGLTIGTMIFEWQTVPEPLTNPPPAAP